MKRNPLYKTTIVIWTNDDPEGMELEDLAREATCGDALCTRQVTVPIHDLEHYLESTPEAVDEIQAIDSFFEFLDLDASIRAPFEQHIYELHGLPASHYSVRRAIKNIHAQILWIHDEDDEMTPLSDALLVKEDNNPNVHFEITKGYGHRNIYRQNKVVKQILEFL